MTYCTNHQYELGSRVVLFTAARTSSVNASLVLMHTHALTTIWIDLPVVTKRVVIPYRRGNGYYADVMTKLLARLEPGLT
jgi:hypothetical protein